MSSPGHKTTLIDKWNTTVNLGIACNEYTCAVVQQFERNYIISVLRITNGNVANATRIAGRNRTDFYKLLNRHGINPADFRSPGE